LYFCIAKRLLGRAKAASSFFDFQNWKTFPVLQAALLFAMAWPAMAQGVSAKLLMPPYLEGRKPEYINDDLRIARLAMGLRVGSDVDQARLDIGIKAILATDRFRGVGARIEDAPEGKLVVLQLDPWPAIKSVKTDIPKELKKNVQPWLPDLRKGTRPGDIAIETWKKKVHEWLPIWGYPNAAVDISRNENGDALAISIAPGDAAILSQIEITGDIGTIPIETVLKDLGFKPKRQGSALNAEARMPAVLAIEKKIWTIEAKRQAIHRLNRRYAKYSHLFAKASFSEPEPAIGKLAVEIDAGPSVVLKVEGIKMGIGELKKYLGLPNVDRHASDYLGEAERRLKNKFQSEGRFHASVSLKRSAIEGRYAEKIDCIVKGTGIVRISDIIVKTGSDLDSLELKKAAKTDFGTIFFRSPKGTPEFAENCRDHVLSRLLAKGYADAKAKYEWGAQSKRSNLLITVNEGKQAVLKEIVIDYETNSPAVIKSIRGQLLSYFDADKNHKEGIGQFEFFHNRMDWDSQKRVKTPMKWELAADSDKLTVLVPIPFIKIDIAAIRSELQVALASQGVQSPIVEIEVATDANSNVTVRLNVPAQPTERLRRIIIQGAENTKPDFIRAEMRPAPNKPGIYFGQPLVASSIAGARTNLGSLGIFSSIDARPMSEVEGAASQATAWGPGDYLFQFKERPLWNFSNSFSYDKGTGYQIGMGAQRINLGGTAKTLDFSVRAGDGTIDSAALRKLFPTGDQNRSLDIYSIGFSDPWFFPDAWLNEGDSPFLSKWLKSRGLLRADLAYIKERQNAFLIFRRRMISSLEWRLYDIPGDVRTVRLGYRFESAGVQGPSEEEMIYAVRSPARSIFSIPFVQLIWDTRDHPFDAKSGGMTTLQIEAALQALGTSANSSFLKADFRQSWNFSIGRGARYGVVSLAFRFGVARPTASSSLEMPLSERFFAGGPGTHRGIEPDQLGPFDQLIQRSQEPPYGPIIGPNGKEIYQTIPIGGQGIAIGNLDYRFPMPFIGQWIWGELFIDSGEVYGRVREFASKESLPPFPHWRTSAGLGLVLKLGGFPIKVEYAWDAREIVGKRDSNEAYTEYVNRTRLKSLLISAGMQF
jgi:outer membrane protein assembly factor BamA